MDEIYAVLVTIDYPDAITGGLRRSTDVARGILEKTRGDLTVAVRQRDLERQLAEFRADLAAHRADSRTVKPARTAS
jgi:translin